MSYVRKHIVAIICIVSLILMLVGLLFWNYVSEKQYGKKEEKPVIDVSDADNVDIVEAKLGTEIKITQGYLMTYTSKKSSIWYMSSAYVKSLKFKDDIAIIELTENKNDKKIIIANIDKDKCTIKKGDTINFVGTVDLKDGSIDLAKISVDKIDYKNVKEMEFTQLYNNINMVLDNYFLVNGYMVTDEDQYKLFDTKDSYTKNKNYGNYFTLTWKEKFEYTGNQDVTVKCKIADTYKLKECELIKK